MDDLALEHGHLAVEELDEVPKRLHPDPVSMSQLAAVEQLGAPHAEQVGHRHVHALFSQHGVDLELAVGAEADELGPVAHQLP
jgi:hypothetical protein